MRTATLLLIAQLVVAVQLVAAPGTVLAADAIQPATTARATLNVDGMVSESCPVLLTAALKRVDGVHHVEASYASHSATVEFDPQRISLDDIRRTIKRQAGFDTAIAD